jgi:hypothetical protein
MRRVEVGAAFASLRHATADAPMIVARKNLRVRAVNPGRFEMLRGKISGGHGVVAKKASTIPAPPKFKKVHGLKTPRDSPGVEGVGGEADEILALLSNLAHAA